ncbi:hypothetical protein CSB67_3023 [Enterobacter hormaechei]|nr:hypothetical protein CSB67_3023 [Enterobacter hormaechei]
MLYPTYFVYYRLNVIKDKYIQHVLVYSFSYSYDTYIL